MDAGEAVQLAQVSWTTLAVAAAAGVVLGWVRLRYLGRARRAARAVCAEFAAYVRLELACRAGELLPASAESVCATIVRVSGFRGAALLLRDSTERIRRIASAGMQGELLAELESWCGVLDQEPYAGRLGRHPLERRAAMRAPGGRSGCVPVQLGPVEALALPVCGGRGRLAGVLVVAGAAPNHGAATQRPDAMLPLESLAARLTCALEHARMSEQLTRAEKLAGLGQLSRGLAHELKNPLTAVLGFAELIGEGAREPQSRADAKAIAQEALRMRDTIDALTHFWQPAGGAEEPVEMVALIGELAGRCAATLEQRGVRLVLETTEAPAVRGSRPRLRLVFEHLLNHSAQSVAERPTSAGEAPEIRVAINFDGGRVLVTVSDTGMGFAEPARVFDAFSTSRTQPGGMLEAGESDGVRFSVCSTIVREHGGEISAFNLQPRGSAIVVELPVMA